MKQVILLLAVILNGCASQTYQISQNHSGGSFSEETMQNFFIAGIAQQAELDAAKICGGSDNIIKVESRLSLLDGFLGVLTQGIYTPRTAKVTCKRTY